MLMKETLSAMAELSEISRTRPLDCLANSVWPVPFVPSVASGGVCTPVASMCRQRTHRRWPATRTDRTSRSGPAVQFTHSVGVGVKPLHVVGEATCEMPLGSIAELRGGDRAVPRSLPVVQRHRSGPDLDVGSG